MPHSLSEAFAVWLRTPTESWIFLDLSAYQEVLEFFKYILSVVVIADHFDVSGVEAIRAGVSGTVDVTYIAL